MRYYDRQFLVFSQDQLWVLSCQHLEISSESVNYCNPRVQVRGRRSLGHIEAVCINLELNCWSGGREWNGTDQHRTRKLAVCTYGTTCQNANLAVICWLHRGMPGYIWMCHENHMFISVAPVSAAKDHRTLVLALNR